MAGVGATVVSDAASSTAPTSPGSPATHRRHPVPEGGKQVSWFAAGSQSSEPGASVLLAGTVKIMAPMTRTTRCSCGGRSSLIFWPATIFGLRTLDKGSRVRRARKVPRTDHRTLASNRRSYQYRRTATAAHRRPAPLLCNAPGDTRTIPCAQRRPSGRVRRQRRYAENPHAVTTVVRRTRPIHTSTRI
jgi:hypothetical protein